MISIEKHRQSHAICLSLVSFSVLKVFCFTSIGNQFLAKCTKRSSHLQSLLISRNLSQLITDKLLTHTLLCVLGHKKQVIAVFETVSRQKGSKFWNWTNYTSRSVGRRTVVQHLQSIHDTKFFNLLRYDYKMFRNYCLFRKRSTSITNRNTW